MKNALMGWGDFAGLAVMWLRPHLIPLYPAVAAICHLFAFRQLTVTAFSI